MLLEESLYKEFFLYLVDGGSPPCVCWLSPWLLTQHDFKSLDVGKCCNRSSVCLKEPPLFLYIQMQLCKHQTLKDWLIERKSSICFSTSFKIFMQVNQNNIFLRPGFLCSQINAENLVNRCSLEIDGFVKIRIFSQKIDLLEKNSNKLNCLYFYFLCWFIDCECCGVFPLSRNDASRFEGIICWGIFF